LASKMPGYVPRIRKHKVKARLKAEAEGHGRREDEDQNVEEILPAREKEVKAKKAQIRAELRQSGVKVSNKKAKRLEKYIETKLWKDENKELLAKLAEQKIDTSLFSSTRSLGQGKETKRQALSRALREKQAGLDLAPSQEELLYEKRQGAGIDSGEDETEEDDEPLNASQRSGLIDAETDLSFSSAIGSGLKRKLETDEVGRPVIQKRQRRGGVQSKISFRETQAVGESEFDDEWTGFSDDEVPAGGENGEDVNGIDDEFDEEEGPEDESDETPSSGDVSNEEEFEAGLSESDEEGEDEEAAEQGRRKERSSAFKAWALQQRNEALGYESAPASTGLLEIPKPTGFTPRPVEQDPLPLELRPLANATRTVFSVAISRSPEIQEARLKLPVVADEQRLMEAIHNFNIVVICGATGSGKTTQVPQFLYEAGYGTLDSPTPGMIGVTQPRRVAAVSMSRRVADELGDHSKIVGYQIRFEGTVDPKTAIKFMTDGVLLREVAQDITLRKYSAIIIDEAHERSVNTDILVGMLSRVVKLRSDLAADDPSIKPLKLVIMSATLRVEDLTQNPTLFSVPPPVVEIEGRQHPVTVHFSRKTEHDYVKATFKKVSRGHKKLPPGDFLVFLTGLNEILQVQKLLKSAFGGLNTVSGPKVRISANEAPVEIEDVDFGDINDMDGDDVDSDRDEDDEEDEDDFRVEDEENAGPPAQLKMHILPLYSLLPTREQLRVFEPAAEGTRRVILATNVAETSLTIPGVRYVFDCGRAKERRYGRLSGVQSYEIGWISKASASQRSGRAGRTGPGHCYRLYSSAVYERDFPEHTDPELLRMPVEGVVLQLKAMNLQHVVNFPFPTPPKRESLVKAEKLLSYLSAISPDGQVTQIGSTMSIFPLSPRFARILLVGHLHNCLPYTIALVAGLSAADVFIPENQAIPALAAQDESEIRTQADVLAEDRRDNIRRTFNAVQKNFCFLDDKSDAIKLLQVVGEFAHEPTEEWCERHFVRFKVLKEIQQLRRQIVELLKANIPAFANINLQDKLAPPTSKQVAALKQMIAAGFIDQVAIRADLAPVPPEQQRKPRRAVEVPYLPLIPIDKGEPVYIHPASPLAHLSTGECPEYVVYSYLQRAAASGVDSEQKPKARMHALTDITGAQLASLAKGTPLITYGKPIKEVSTGSAATESGEGTFREVWVVPYLREESVGGQGWPLPAKKVKQRKLAGKGWVVE
jgi:ATP-dependent RNA helicase DHX37/DHR1